MGVKVTNINDEFCETVPILNRKRGKKHTHKNATPGMDMRSSPKNGYKISPFDNCRKPKKIQRHFSVLQIKTYKLTFLE